uniref:F-box domain-containing protein n=1 Tax=Davidia involucrata TaxID=16924 RepID=A0A5B7BYK1_DAVIN
MDRLPGEIVVDILSRLPIKSLMRCRCVCKPWRNLTYDPRFIHYHLNRSSHKNPNLILTSTICIDATFFRTQMYFLEHHHTHNYTCTDVDFSLPNFEEFQVIGSCNGLLCLVHRMNTSRICICNPFTRDYIKFPNPISPSQQTREMTIGFGYCSKRNEYKIVEIIHSSTLGDLRSEVYVCTVGDGSWRGIGNVPYVMIRWQLASKVFLNGALHWFSELPANLIVSFDIANEVFGVIPGPGIDVGQGSYALGVLSGCFSITDSSFRDRVEIWVMKEYGVEESWVKCFAINFDQVGWNIRYIRILCSQKNGEILMLYNNQLLLSYNPQTMRLGKVSIVGLPSWFEAVTHVGSLITPSG